MLMRRGRYLARPHPLYFLLLIEIPISMRVMLSYLLCFSATRPRQIKLFFIFFILPIDYRIAGNFRGAKYSWFSWLEVWPRIFYPRMKRPCLPLPTIQAATTKILSTKCLNISEPRIFCPAIRYSQKVSLYWIEASTIRIWGSLVPLVFFNLKKIGPELRLYLR